MYFFSLSQCGICMCGICTRSTCFHSSYWQSVRDFGAFLSLLSTIFPWDMVFHRIWGLPFWPGCLVWRVSSWDSLPYPHQCWSWSCAQLCSAFDVDAKEPNLGLMLAGQVLLLLSLEKTLCHPTLFQRCLQRQDLQWKRSRSVSPCKKKEWLTPLSSSVFV